MDEMKNSTEHIRGFLNYLQQDERSKSTIDKYMHDIKVFYGFLGNDTLIEKERVIAYKEYLSSRYKISSANSMLAALNKFLGWMGLENCRVKSFKNQRQLFCDQNRELSRNEYERLVEAARGRRNSQLEMIMQTICGTGIRVGELPFITVEAVRQGRAEVLGKGKRRVILIVPKLRKHLLYYCRRKRISKGPVFVTSGGRPVSRIQVWSNMKALAEAAGVAAEKIFPHNLRHLFARLCYKKKKDIVYLADLLGHSSIETTRIYTITSGREHEAMLNSLGLVF